ncbi:fructose-1,6-bisphosphatase-3 [Aequitasia blattaphilus]|uniref:Fructose-1,6-bisphosphatase class 3 n=1 Tax=Aequitasia blattaphilus TaxID=2949332 RepID=A0ABT1E6H9_9FIRM|nr:fructose-1,6-bisphosphatase [Aequitasia blattaphilus]MCP1101442.1 fructose-1,6-bisphosphatase [Aequitasia blattaphilus]MCR8614082.1 fructose-1,6-bisphosphatase [Aequitasia blattaphilus]
MRDIESRYLHRLSEMFPTIAATSTEIINLQAILSLPKGTEHFLTDIHGEDEAFAHVLKNGSGAVRRKVQEVFGNTLSAKDMQSLATLIYYPKEKIEQIKKQEVHIEDWYKITLYRLVKVCKAASSKYTRSKVRKALPKDFAYIIDELINERADDGDKDSYYNEIVCSIIKVGRAEEFIVAMGELIQRLVVDHLHIVGDIYDRGPGPHKIMDKLMEYHSVDIQWGNHDVLWMGAAAGQLGCITNVIRICARYGNLDLLEDCYGINLLPLATYALNTYKDDPCTCFQLKGEPLINAEEQELNIKMHKAISILQFKVEGQTIKERPEYKMADRNLLESVNYEEGTITLRGEKYDLLDANFPTIDPKNPNLLTKEEVDILNRLEQGFLNCEKLQKHMRFLLNKGGLYKVYNNNLLFHGCVPLAKDGSLKEIEIYGQTYKGKALYEALEVYVRKGFFALNDEERQRGKDLMWYIWLHENSPLFGKDKMATFERYFIAEEITHKETKNPYYEYINQEETANMILDEFGLITKEAHIVNGHVPVKSKKGESPLKSNGKVLVIDGGFSKAYQKETGIAGYTLIYNSYGLILVSHDPFESKESAIEKESDIHSETIVVKRTKERKRVGDTDVGKELLGQIVDLEKLLDAYRNGTIIERG